MSGQSQASKLCAYCGQPARDVTKDHVVPRGLWENGQRPEYLITVPACSSCNSSYSEDETYFRTVLPSMISDEDLTPKAQSLLNGAVARSIEKKYIKPGEVWKGLSRQPHFTKSGIYTGNVHKFQVDIGRVNRVIGKIVRGSFFYKSKVPLSRSHAVGVWLGNAFWEECAHFLESMTPYTGLGDEVFQARFARHSVDLNQTTHLYVFYGSIGFFAATLPLDQFGADASPDEVHVMGLGPRND